MTDSIIKPNRPPVNTGMKKGIAANREVFTQTMKNINPNEVQNRLGLVLDDSGSMGTDKMKDAHVAVRGFTQNCNALDTSIAIYPMNKEAKSLTCDYDLVNMYVSGISATGGTPMYRTLKKLIETEEITRAVVFSDGSPTDSSVLMDQDNDDFYYGTKDRSLALEIVKIYTAHEVCIDTIFIGTENTSGFKEMKKLAELTNGTFIHFKDSSSLSKGLKYLAPKYRALLANPELKKRIEAGETI